VTEPTNGLTPPNEAGKFDEHVAATIRTAVDEWRTGNNPADVHGVSMPEYIRRSLADAGLLAPYHRTHSLCLEWDDTAEGFAILSDRSEASQVVVLLDTVRQVMQERDLALALQRAGFRSMKDQVDAMGRQIKAQQAQLDQAIKGEQLARLRRYVRDLTESVPDISGDDNLSTEDAYNRGYADADVATGKALGALLDVKFNEVLDSPEFRAALESRAPELRREVTTSQWEPGDIALDHTNFVHRRFEHGWRVVGRNCGVQYDDESMETALGPLLRLQSVPDEVDVVGAVPIEVAARLRGEVDGG
jgi:hypothetical protein